MEKAQGQIQDCLQHEPPFCAVACPFNFDIRDFIEKLQRGGFNAAYRAYLNAVGFPGIVAALCDEPCKGVCLRRDVDGAISLRLLEAASLAYARNPNPNNYNLPPKGKKIAIIGAGIGGLACALRLAAKKYEVSVYERSSRIGGHLWERLPSDLFLKEIERQFMYETYTLCLDTEITSLDDLNVDAIYVATGAGGQTFGLARHLAGAFACDRPGVFMGGSLTGSGSMQAIADGLRVVHAIERFIKVGSMNQPEEQRATRLQLDPAAVTPCAPVLPANGQIYTQEEAVEEAKRCLKCACEACLRACDLMRYFKKFPKRIAEEVELTIHPGTLDGNGTLATRFISTCNQCGLCKEVCPVKIDTGDFLLQNHRIMREKGAMPWAWHDFFLRDMAFTNGEDAHLCRLPPGYSQSQYMFFPGCQLGASDPQYVLESYHWLLSKKPDTALLLHCCGAPAEWAGDEPIHAKVMAQIRADWLALGSPTAIFACPTCRQMFQRHLPEINGVFLYDLLLEEGLSPVKNGQGETVSVFDPCSSRGETGVQQAVRGLVDQAGFNRQPLPSEGKLAACCSWGGHVSVANPAYASEVVRARITQGDAPLVAYCANCRDIFAAAQKPVYHILDLCFGIHDASRRPPTLTQRQTNRTRLKNQALAAWWKDESPMDAEKHLVHLEMTPEVRQKLSHEMILETDVETVIHHCETRGKKVMNAKSGHFMGHFQVGNMTYWVEYAPLETGFALINAYSHRMSIDKG